MSDFFDNVRKLYGGLTNTQKQVADFMLEHPDVIAFKRLEELSMMIGVSTTSVIRFARSIGYKGYADMQQDIQQSIVGKASLPDRLIDAVKSTKQDQLLIDSFKRDIDNIASTLHLLSENDLAKAVSNIIAAQNIYVLGTRGNFSVAHYLGYRLSQIKRGVHLVSGLSMDYPEEIASIRRGDVCIAFLTPRYSRMTANLVAWMKKRGVMIILFTKEGGNEINLYGDIILPCRTDGISYKSSLIALFAVCNYILAAVVPQNHDESMEVLAQTEELLGQGFFLGL